MSDDHIVMNVPGVSTVDFTRRWKAIARECGEGGWDSRKAQAVTDAALRTASYMDVVPSPDGGVQLEIHAGGMDIEIAVDPDGLIVEVTTHRQRGH